MEFALSALFIVPVLLAIPMLISFLAIHKVIQFFSEPQTEYLYSTVQDATGNIVESVSVKSKN